MTITDFDTIHEEDGPLMGFLLYAEKGGSIDHDEVEAFLNGPDALDYLYDETGGAFEVVETYVRKVPGGDWMRYQYQDAPGRGARACTRVELWHQWDHWCMNHIYEPAFIGIPVERVLDPIWPMVSVHIIPPERRRGHSPYPQDDMAYVYLCRDCARRFHEREDAERARRVAEYRAERARSEPS